MSKSFQNITKITYNSDLSDSSLKNDAILCRADHRQTDEIILRDAASMSDADEHETVVSTYVNEVVIEPSTFLNDNSSLVVDLTSTNSAQDLETTLV